MSKFLNVYINNAFIIYLSTKTAILKYDKGIITCFTCNVSHAKHFICLNQNAACFARNTKQFARNFERSTWNISCMEITKISRCQEESNIFGICLSSHRRDDHLDLTKMVIWVIYDITRYLKGQNYELSTASNLKMIDILKSITEHRLFKMMIKA